MRRSTCGRTHGVLQAEKQLQTAKREGKINLLTKQLKLKFGALPPKYQGMIETAGLKRIEKWAEKILTADTLEDVFEV